MHPTNEQLKQFLNEPLDGAGCESVDEHLVECASCRQRVEQIIKSAFGGSIRPHQGKRSTASRVAARTADAAQDTISPADRSMTAARIAALQESLGRRFVILNEIAEGGMGVVCRAMDRELRREVAIKMSTAKPGGTADVRFRREAQISAQLEHPGIVPVHETGHLKDGRQYIALKLIKGETLSAVIQSGEENHNLARLFPVFNDVANAMAYAHSRDIIHRDLKPENVMVGEFGEVQIMDWGLARKLRGSSRHETIGEDSQRSQSSPNRPPDQTTPEPDHTITTAGATQQGDVFGTPAYMPPEQARGDQADKRTDVFSLGGILYEILTGSPPFDGPTASAALAQSLSNDLAAAFQRLDVSGADEELIELTKSCLASDPNARPSDAQAVSERFANYLAGRERQFEETRIEKVRATERLIAQQNRTRTLIRFGFAILASVVALAAAATMYLSEKNTRLTNEAKAERDALEVKIRHESEIRNSIAAAERYSRSATTHPAHKQHIDWTLALKEIEKASPLVSETISPELTAEFSKLATSIRSEAASADRAKEFHEVEAACAADLFPLRECTFFPEDMRLCQPVDPLPQFQTIFAKLGVEPGVISQDGISRIANSEFRTEFIHSLMIWRREIEITGNYRDQQQSEAVRLQRVDQWLAQLIEQIDPDSFRSRLRQIELDLDEAVALSKTEEATASLLAVYTCADAMNTFGVSLNDRTVYLLRAHQAFPTDFFVNWFLPLISGGAEQKETFALAAYSMRPQNPAVLAMLGLALVRNDKPQQAIRPLKQLTEVAPWYFLGHKTLAIAYQNTGDHENAAFAVAAAQTAFEESRERFIKRLEQYRARNNKADTEALEAYIQDAESVAQLNVSNAADTSTAPSELPEETSRQRDKLLADIEGKKEEILSNLNYPALHGQLHELYKSLFQLLSEAGRPELVVQAVDQAIEDFERFGEDCEISTPHERLAKVCDQHQRWETGIEAIKRARKVHPEYGPHKATLIKFHQALCQQYVDARRPALVARAVDAAIEDIQELSRSDKGDSDYIHKRLAAFAEKYGRYEDAIAGYERAIKANPAFKDFRRQLAELKTRYGREQRIAGSLEKANTLLDQSIAYFREQVVLEPANKTPHERLAEACDYRGFWEESLKHKKLAIEIVPAYVPHHHHYAEIAIRLSQQQAETDIATATETLTSAIAFLTDVAPDSLILAEPHEELSRLHTNAKRYNEAISCLEFVISRRPGDQLLIERLAHLYDLAGQHAKAQSLIKALLEENVDSEHLKQTLKDFAQE